MTYSNFIAFIYHTVVLVVLVVIVVLLGVAVDVLKELAQGQKRLLVGVDSVGERIRDSARQIIDEYHRIDGRLATDIQRSIPLRPPDAPTAPPVPPPRPPSPPPVTNKPNPVTTERPGMNTKLAQIYPTNKTAVPAAIPRFLPRSSNVIVTTSLPTRSTQLSLPTAPAVVPQPLPSSNKSNLMKQKIKEKEKRISTKIREQEIKERENKSKNRVATSTQNVRFIQKSARSISSRFPSRKKTSLRTPGSLPPNPTPGPTISRIPNRPSDPIGAAVGRVSVGTTTMTTPTAFRGLPARGYVPTEGIRKDLLGKETKGMLQTAIEEGEVDDNSRDLSTDTKPDQDLSIFSASPMLEDLPPITDQDGEKGSGDNEDELDLNRLDKCVVSVSDTGLDTATRNHSPPGDENECDDSTISRVEVDDDSDAYDDQENYIEGSEGSNTSLLKRFFDDAIAKKKDETGQDGEGDY